jgi:hypothetical protein
VDMVTESSHNAGSCPGQSKSQPEDEGLLRLTEWRGALVQQLVVQSWQSQVEKKEHEEANAQSEEGRQLNYR